MPTKVIIRANAYYDSVTLMAITDQVGQLPGVTKAVVVMGTEMNKELLQNVGLLTPEARAAQPTDLVIALAGESEEALTGAAARAEALLQERQAGRGSGAAAVAPTTIASAVRQVPGANLALISVPGEYAAREARQALEHGLHVMLYSDNVPLTEEIRLKELAREKGLLLMGPDCGTAIIDGVGLGFANAVRRGPVGIVAASGTGAQELSSLIDKLGSGISQLIGTGGRDLSAEVGGIMMLEGLRLLQHDPDTRVIVLISKPPAPAVAERVQAAAAAVGNPVVLCFLNHPGSPTIDEAALRAVSLATGRPEAELAPLIGYGQPLPVVQPGPGRRYVRGLFSGGTLCDQALLILEQALGPVWCNVHPDPARRLAGGEPSRDHTLLDLGDDEFTRGRPHPMLDNALRRERIRAEAADPEVAVILLDLVLGHGVHPDPAGSLAGAIAEAVAAGVAVVAAVTGTAGDPQGFERQVTTLTGAGALVLPTARLAAQTAAQAVAGRARGRGATPGATQTGAQETTPGATQPGTAQGREKR